jgi:hypothetical protein
MAGDWRIAGMRIGTGSQSKYTVSMALAAPDLGIASITTALPFLACKLSPWRKK